MDKTPAADSINFMFRGTGSTSRVDNPSASITECLIDVSLPQEIITEILLRLPVKSLLKFKCVSKPWLSLISSPLFIRSHFSKSSSMVADGLNLELLFATETGIKKCSLYSALHDADPTISAFGFPAQNNLSIVGIINGLICLNLEGTNLCLWNPALNKVKHLNFYPEASSGSGCVRGDYIFSFGHEESNDDYKVVCFQVLEGVFDAEVRIYSLKADSWRRIDQLNGFFLPYAGLFANGKIYWPDSISPPGSKKFSLDMLSEKFVEVQVQTRMEVQVQTPEYDAGNCVTRMGVSAGGRLLVLCNCCKGKNVDLWALDKRGVEECWCKLFSIPRTDAKSMISIFNCQVLCILNNTEIVSGRKDGLLLYNWKKKEFRNIKLAVGISTHWRVAAYVESLFWPVYTA